MDFVLPKKSEKIFQIGQKISSVFLLSFLFFVLAPYLALAASMSVTPAGGTFEVGDRITLKVVVSSNVPFNGVSGVLSYPTSTLSVESVSKAGSVIDFWVTEPTVLNTSGTVKFEGVALGSSLTTSGTIITINLRAKSAGTAALSFISGQILANDGEGTDITGNLIGSNISITAATAEPKPTVTPKPSVPVEVTEVPQPKPTLTAPEIFSSLKSDHPAIFGVTEYPHTQALVTFMATDGTKVFILGTADNRGDFSVLVPNSLKRGSYTVSAVMVKPDKTNSEVSNVLYIEVGSIVSDITREVWILIGLLASTILYLLVRTYFHFKKEKNIHRVIKKEVAQAEEVLHKSFDILREDVIDYDNKKLTAAEHKRMTEFRKDIDSAEKVISKEVDDIR
ncbi:MAG: hypothetical protein KBC06_02700 [Candidatus Pacebacteria bacterium]|nr:hypothetical protein [Candidatus Paceibacterota bacterium]